MSQHKVDISLESPTEEMPVWLLVGSFILAGLVSLLIALHISLVQIYKRRLERIHEECTAVRGDQVMWRPSWWLANKVACYTYIQCLFCTKKPLITGLDDITDEVSVPDIDIPIMPPPRPDRTHHAGSIDERFPDNDEERRTGSDCSNYENSTNERNRRDSISLNGPKSMPNEQNQPTASVTQSPLINLGQPMTAFAYPGTVLIPCSTPMQYSPSQLPTVATSANMLQQPIQNPNLFIPSPPAIVPNDKNTCDFLPHLCDPQYTRASTNLVQNAERLEDTVSATPEAAIRRAIIDDLINYLESKKDNGDNAKGKSILKASDGNVSGRRVSYSTKNEIFTPPSITEESTTAEIAEQIASTTGNSDSTLLEESTSNLFDFSPDCDSLRSDTFSYSDSSTVNQDDNITANNCEGENGEVYRKEHLTNHYATEYKASHMYSVVDEYIKEAKRFQTYHDSTPCKSILAQDSDSDFLRHSYSVNENSFENCVPHASTDDNEHAESKSPNVNCILEIDTDNSLLHQQIDTSACGDGEFNAHGIAINNLGINERRMEQSLMGEPPMRLDIIKPISFSECRPDWHYQNESAFLSPQILLGCNDYSSPLTNDQHNVPQQIFDRYSSLYGSIYGCNCSFYSRIFSIPVDVSKSSHPPPHRVGLGKHSEKHRNLPYERSRLCRHVDTNVISISRHQCREIVSSERNQDTNSPCVEIPVDELALRNSTIISQMPTVNNSATCTDTTLKSQTPHLTNLVTSNATIVSQTPIVANSQTSDAIIIGHTLPLGYSRTSSAIISQMPPVTDSKAFSTSITGQTPDIIGSQTSNAIIISRTPFLTDSQTSTTTVISQTPPMNVSQTPSVAIISQTPSLTESDTSSDMMISQTLSLTDSHTFCTSTIIGQAPSITDSQPSSTTISQTPFVTDSATSSAIIISQTPSLTDSQIFCKTPKTGHTPSNTDLQTPSAAISQTLLAIDSQKSHEMVVGYQTPTVSRIQIFNHSVPESFTEPLRDTQTTIHDIAEGHMFPVSDTLNHTDSEGLNFRDNKSFKLPPISFCKDDKMLFDLEQYSTIGNDAYSAVQQKSDCVDRTTHHKLVRSKSNPQVSLHDETLGVSRYVQKLHYCKQRHSNVLGCAKVPTKVKYLSAIKDEGNGTRHNDKNRDHNSYYFEDYGVDELSNQIYSDDEAIVHSSATDIHEDDLEITLCSLIDNLMESEKSEIDSLPQNEFVHNNPEFRRENEGVGCSIIMVENPETDPLLEEITTKSMNANLHDNFGEKNMPGSDIPVSSSIDVNGVSVISHHSDLQNKSMGNNHNCLFRPHLRTFRSASIDDSFYSTPRRTLSHQSVPSLSDAKTIVGEEDINNATIFDLLNKQSDKSTFSDLMGIAGGIEESLGGVNNTLTLTSPQCTTSLRQSDENLINVAPGGSRSGEKLVIDLLGNIFDNKTKGISRVPSYADRVNLRRNPHVSSMPPADLESNTDQWPAESERSLIRHTNSLRRRKSNEFKHDTHSPAASRGPTPSSSYTTDRTDLCTQIAQAKFTSDELSSRKNAFNSIREYFEHISTPPQGNSDRRRSWDALTTCIRPNKCSEPSASSYYEAGQLNTSLDNPLYMELNKPVEMKSKNDSDKIFSHESSYPSQESMTLGINGTHLPTPKPRLCQTLCPADSPTVSYEYNDETKDFDEFTGREGQNISHSQNGFTTSESRSHIDVSTCKYGIKMDELRKEISQGVELANVRWKPPTSATESEGECEPFVIHFYSSDKPDNAE